MSGVDAKQCHGIRASGTARPGLRRRPPSADKGVRMIWKLRGTRPPTRGGVPACPTFWSGNHLHSSRARPLTGARSRPGEESDDHVFITRRARTPVEQVLIPMLQPDGIVLNQRDDTGSARSRHQAWGRLSQGDRRGPPRYCRRRSTFSTTALFT
jgi:hypothetical protein